MLLAFTFGTKDGFIVSHREQCNIFSQGGDFSDDGHAIAPLAADSCLADCGDVSCANELKLNPNCLESSFNALG